MAKISDCDHCFLCANESSIVCAVHPSGPINDTCLDFRPDPQIEGKRFVDFLGLESQQQSNEIFSNPFDLELSEKMWEPNCASYYAGELILQPQERWTRQEQLDLLDTHPIFTSRCPACNRQFPQDEKPLIHWDCPCGWMDDTV